MFDMQYFPGASSATQGNTWIFNTSDTVAVATGWMPWLKPVNLTMCHILAMGAGGGGGNGASGSAGGGGGGAAGSIDTLLIPLIYLPDTLFVKVGVGGAANTAGTASAVSLYPKVSTNEYFIIQGGNGGAGGNGTASAGTGGSTGTGMSLTTATLAALGILQHPTSVSGGNGANGSNGAGAGSSITPLDGGGWMLSGGAGGGSNNPSNGGSINARGFSPLISGGTSAGAGQNGINMWKPFYSTGGAGGAGSSTAATGGAGGNGGRGCGGGGGGASASGTGGAGGRGGDGIVIITCWEGEIMFVYGREKPNHK